MNDCGAWLVGLATTLILGSMMGADPFTITIGAIMMTVIYFRLVNT